jgi:ribosome-binding factor A
MPNTRPERLAEQIRVELSELLAREVHEPGVGFVTLTLVKVTSDLQLARIYYTSFGDDKAQKESAKALQRAMPFLRRQVAQRVRLQARAGASSSSTTSPSRSTIASSRSSRS